MKRWQHSAEETPPHPHPLPPRPLPPRPPLPTGCRSSRGGCRGSDWGQGHGSGWRSGDGQTAGNIRVCRDSGILTPPASCVPLKQAGVVIINQGKAIQRLAG
jgi:hypothetical protein